MGTSLKSAIGAARNEIQMHWGRRVIKLFSATSVAGSMLSGAISDGLGMLLDGWVADDANAIDEALERITRILAVQEFPPSQAMSLFFELKPVLDDLCPASEKAVLQDRLEELTLKAFDSYMMHREKIYQLKVDESRRRMFMALRRAEA